MDAPAAIGSRAAGKDDVATGLDLDLVGLADEVDEARDRMGTDLQQSVPGLAQHPVAEGPDADEGELDEIVEGEMVDRAQIARPNVIAQSAERAFEQHAVVDADRQATSRG